MINRPLSLNDFTESLIGISNYQKDKFSDNSEYKKMLEVLVRAIDGELTERQRQCVVMYYGKQISLKDIALELNISESTISRHLKKSRNRLAKVMKYYFNRL